MERRYLLNRINNINRKTQYKKALKKITNMNQMIMRCTLVVLDKGRVINHSDPRIMSSENVGTTTMTTVIVHKISKCLMNIKTTLIYTLLSKPRLAAPKMKKWMSRPLDKKKETKNAQKIHFTQTKSPTANILKTVLVERKISKLHLLLNTQAKRLI